MQATIVKLDLDKLVAKDNIRGQYFAFLPEQCYLYGLSLKGLNLTKLYKIGQLVIIPENGEREWGAHVGVKKDGSKLRKKLTGYVTQLGLGGSDVVSDIVKFLELRANTNSLQSNALHSDSQPSDCHVSKSMSAAYVNASGKIVSVSKDSGIVSVQGVELEFPGKSVFIFGLHVYGWSPSLFLNPGSSVSVDVENGHVKTVWLGSARSVSSLHLVSDMRRFCEARDIDDEIISHLEMRMIKRYEEVNGIQHNVDLSNERCIVQAIDKQGGTVETTDKSRTLTFTLDNVRLFAVPLRGVNDLTLFIKTGQAVFIDSISNYCSMVWVSTERTVLAPRALESLRMYCNARNIPEQDLVLLERRHLQLQIKISHNKIQGDETVGTILSLEKDHGQLICEGRAILHFKKEQLSLFGYKLGDLDMDILSSRKFEVNIQTMDGVLKRVWVGSLEKSSEDLHNWIKHNIRKKNRDILIQHWNLHQSVAINSRCESETSVLPDGSIQEELPEEELEFWAPTVDLRDEKPVVLIKAPATPTKDNNLYRQQEKTKAASVAEAGLATQSQVTHCNMDEEALELTYTDQETDALRATTESLQSDDDAPHLDAQSCESYPKSDSGSQVKLTCNGALGKIVSITGKSGIVNIFGVNLGFSAKRIFMFGQHVLGWSPTLILEPGSKVYANIKNGKVKTLWLDTARTVSSLKLVADMRQFCEGRNVDEMLISHFEKRMIKNYEKLKDMAGIPDLKNVKCIVQSITKRGGAVETLDKSYNLTFLPENVKLFAVPLKGVSDISLFVNIGQLVYVDSTSNYCTAVWISTERTVQAEGILECLKNYCRERNVPKQDVTLLEQRHFHFNSENGQDKANRQGIQIATMLMLEKDKGQILCDGRAILEFKKEQFTLYGHHMGDLDLDMLGKKKFDVNVHTINGVVQKVWVGSVEKSSEKLHQWIKKNVNKRKREFLIEHWNLTPPVTNARCESQEVILPESNFPEEISGEALELWSPLADLTNEEPVALIKTSVPSETSYAVGSQKNTEAAAVAYPATHSQAIQCNMDEGASGVLLTPNTLAAALSDNLALFLLYKEIVQQPSEAHQMSREFVHRFREFNEFRSRNEELESVALSADSGTQTTSVPICHHLSSPDHTSGNSPKSSPPGIYSFRSLLVMCAAVALLVGIRMRCRL